MCIGLDPDVDKMPHLSSDIEENIITFNRRIIQATSAYCVAYKPNLAFYEMHGSRGWRALKETIRMIPNEHFIVADAKRGDIGNTSVKYAKAVFDELNADAVTVAPYMGEDSVRPFLTSGQDRWVILLALTSNAGSGDFQMLKLEDGAPLYRQVMQTAQQWGNEHNLMFVVGATHPETFREIRSIIPDHFILVPGIGAQGGDLEAVCEHGLTNDVGLLVNVSRGVLYADSSERGFDTAAGVKAREYRDQMADILHLRLGI